jgi:predicted transcriptional regulator
MVRKRDRLEVIRDILKIVVKNKNAIVPTRLLRNSNLSTKRFSEYYAELLKKGFVREIQDKDNKKLITLTDKGFNYLEKYNTIINFINEFEL